MTPSTGKLVLKAVPPPADKLAEFEFNGGFRTGPSTSIEPEIAPSKPEVKPTETRPGRDVPLPFRPPDPAKPFHSPDGDPNRRHTVCKKQSIA